MNLLVSYNWLKSYVKLDMTAEVFAKEFSLKSQNIERIERIKPKFTGVITAKILEVKPHPNADRLRLATVSTGKSQLIVVCGAPNIAVGQIVPLAKVGAEVVGDEGIVRIDKSVIRGQESNGMLCSPREVGFGDDHSGILVLPEKTPLGVPLEKVVHLNDDIFDIEVTSNRSDAMSIVGLAREAAAVFETSLITSRNKANLKVLSGRPLAVEVKEKTFCPRYQAIVLTDVEVRPSPAWLQLRLITAGKRPINNLVDITNYILLEYGQPMHVFDYDKVEGNKIVVRKARGGEKLIALDDKEYQLKNSDLVIADVKKPIAIAGVMGGRDSATTINSQTVIFECANFSPLAVRRTSRTLNLYSDSSSLFEKNLSPYLIDAAMLRAIELAQEIAGAKVASPIIDSDKKVYRPRKVIFNPDSVGRYLGINLKLTEMKSILTRLGFKVSGNGRLTVSVPWYRINDIAEEHDLIEEIARIYGYHNLPVTLPDGVLPAASGDRELALEQDAKNILKSLGFTETYNYSMVSARLLEKMDLDPEKSIKIANPLNEDMVLLRTVLYPSLLENAAANVNNFSRLKIFELSNVFSPQEQSLPLESARLCGLVLSANTQDAFLELKGALGYLLKNLGVDYQLAMPDFNSKLWEKDESLNVFCAKTLVGRFGVVKKELLNKFGIKSPVILFDFDFSLIAEASNKQTVFVPLSEFPGVVRDVTAVVAEKLHWSEVSECVLSIDSLIKDISYLGMFKDKSSAGFKSLSFRLLFRSAERTLRSEEVDEVIAKVVSELQHKFNAKIK